MDKLTCLGTLADKSRCTSPRTHIVLGAEGSFFSRVAYAVEAAGWCESCGAQVAKSANSQKPPVS